MTVHVIGFQLQPDSDGHPSVGRSKGAGKADCLALKTGGRVVNTETVEELAAALRRTLACPVVSLLE